MKAKEWFGLAARGTALGTGILPGVSAGTVGIVVDVYDDLLDGIDGLRKKKTFWRSLGRLLPIGVGCVAATLLLMLFWNNLARVFFPFIMVAALAGFVIGALPVISDELKDRKIDKWDILRIAIGFIIAAGIGVAAYVLCYLWTHNVIQWLPDFSEEVLAPFQSPWIFIVVAIVGFISAASCLVPGISGAMILFIFGLYDPILNIFFSSRNEAGDIIIPSVFHDTSRLPSAVLLVLVLLAGVLIGFLVISHALKGLFVTKRHQTFSIVLGFILGSVISMFFNQEMFWIYRDPTVNQWWQFLIGAFAFVGVAIGTYFLIKFAGRRNKKKEIPAEASEPESN